MCHQYGVHCFEKRVAAKVRRGSGCCCARLLECGIAFDEDGRHAQAAAELDIRGRVTDHHAGRCGNRWELGGRLVEHAGKRLSAIALAFLMRTDKEGVDAGAVRLQQFLKMLMHRFHICGRIKTTRDAALIRDDDDQQSRLVEVGNGLRHAGKYAKLFPAGNIHAFRSLLVQDAVAIEEDGSQIPRERPSWRISHPVIIATDGHSSRRAAGRADGLKGAITLERELPQPGYNIWMEFSPTAWWVSWVPARRQAVEEA